MAYELTALIGVGSALPGAVPLPQGAWLLPLEEGTPASAEAAPRGRAVLDVSVEYCASMGGQEAVLYRDGQAIAWHVAGYGAINDGLASLGIAAEPPKDAFDTLGLGRYRRTSQWLRAIAPPPSL